MIAELDAAIEAAPPAVQIILIVGASIGWLALMVCAGYYLAWLSDANRKGRKQ